MIIYFSGNGNTEWCAQQIATATGDRAISISTIVSQGNLSLALKPDEPLGIFFPVHGWKPPRIVVDFVVNMRIASAPSYCYSVCTCGDSIGEAMSVMRGALASRGIRLAAAFSIIMPETYVCLPFMYTDTNENERRKIAAARERLNSISRMVVERTCNHEELTKGPLPCFFTHVVGAFFNRFMITDRPFRVDASRCIHCGKCAKSCPVGNVSLDDKGLPQWRRSEVCTCCMACYHHCPRHAIDYGSITRHRGQYYFGHR